MSPPEPIAENGGSATTLVIVLAGLAAGGGLRIAVAVVLNALRSLGGGEMHTAHGTLPEEAERPWSRGGRGLIVEMEKKL